jgi:hypothetical protein
MATLDLEIGLPKIGQYILEGLNSEEACIMAGFLPKELKDLMDKNEAARAYVDKKHIEYKHEHLKAINRTKSEKTSMWMLEKTRPEEFGSARQRGNGDPIDSLKKLITEIQKNDDNLIRDAEVIEGKTEAIEGKRAGVGSILN